MAPAKLAINTSGTPTKGRIYALHGVTDNAAALCDVSERWSGEFEVVCVDALGHGCSLVLPPSSLRTLSRRWCRVRPR